MCGDWEDLFPMVTIRKDVKDQFDHNLLILDYGDTPYVEKK
jgi:hypothetical protein